MGAVFGAGGAEVNHAGGGVAGAEADAAAAFHGGAALVEAEAAALLGGAVAGDAVFLEEGLDVAREIDLCWLG